MDIWFENAPAGKTWGFVLGNSLQALQNDIKRIRDETQLQIEARENMPNAYDGSLYIDTLPKELLHRAGESSKGVDSTGKYECCAC